LTRLATSIRSSQNCGSLRAAAETSRAKSTERAYKNDWRDFCAFARLIGRAPHPAEPETVALYATDLARRGRAPATIARRLVSIRNLSPRCSPQLGLSQQQRPPTSFDARSAFAQISTSTVRNIEVTRHCNPKLPLPSYSSIRAPS
jgi:hypothetical protein